MEKMYFKPDLNITIQNPINENNIADSEKDCVKMIWSETTQQWINLNPSESRLSKNIVYILPTPNIKLVRKNVFKRIILFIKNIF